MPDRPNVLLLHAHDLGTVLGCYDWPVETPNIDQLAADGARCSEHFCAAPQCGPSRGSLHTGRYPHTNGLMGHHWLGWSIHDEVPTLAQRLHGAGYETFQCGGQHLAGDPADVGFEHSGDVDWTHALDVADETLDMLGGRDDDRPFFASVGFHETHRLDGVGDSDFIRERDERIDADAVDVPPGLPDEPAVAQELAEVYGQVRSLDDGVGRILDWLDETGQTEDTVVVFTADHGLAFPRAKGTCYDRGHETPLILRHPDHIAPGQEIDTLLSNVDFMPTLLEYLDLPRPEGMDGRSFAPLLTGGEYTPREAVFLEITFHDKYCPIRAVRTREHKYIRNFSDGPLVYLPADILDSPSGRAVVDEYYGNPRPAEELYDLTADPGEADNRIDDPDYAAVREDLSERLDRQMEATDDPLLSGDVPVPDEHPDPFIDWASAE
jgi:arylsulfatase A-like enzyme